ncbi:hypothetical protein Slin15195_G064020 [Septoria linicola]|uniref:Uncharacterized protein n=1 Tax=Septoria linicola TaxID=215465 RepID=A0A9Q9AVX5_9PEZI|nr:hypothetical protein Slin14017_G114340 [Septoria linicola]USW53083.1 hypothetical protein Slin15195_G064020 [Septoria linicola]
MAFEGRYPPFPSAAFQRYNERQAADTLCHDNSEAARRLRRIPMPNYPKRDRCRPRQSPQELRSYARAGHQHALRYHHFDAAKQEQRAAPWLKGLNLSFGGADFANRIHHDMMWSDMSSGVDFGEFTNDEEDDDAQSIVHYELDRDDEEEQEQGEDPEEDESSEDGGNDEDENEHNKKQLIEDRVPQGEEKSVNCGVLSQLKAKMSKACKAIMAMTQ